jgi:8-oxo-dGTP diphosphatase
MISEAINWMKVIDKLAWIELQEQRVLSTRSRGKDTYYLPGGKREAGEGDTEALVREIREELTVDLDVASIKFLGTFQAQAHGHADGVLVKMLCYTARYAGTLAASSEIEEVVWLTYADRDKVSPVDKLIFDWLKEKGMLS